MARWFVDARGIEWEVWEIRPRALQADGPAHEPGGAGWLCFESATHRRHLSRYPARWESMPEEGLAALCDAARPQPAFDAEARPLLPVLAW